MVRLATIVSLLVFLFPSMLHAVDRYANPTGSGSSCTSGSPCNLQTATNQAQAGETVWLQDGTYTPANMGFGDGKFRTLRSGTAGNEIVFQAVNSRQAIINGSNDDQVNIGHSHIRFIGIVVDGFYQGSYGGPGDGLVHLNDDQTNILFDDVLLRNSAAAIFKIQQGLTNITLRNSTVHTSGVTMQGSLLYIGTNAQPPTEPWTELIYIHDNILYDGQENAINTKNMTRNVFIYNNQIYNQASPADRPLCTDPECASREGTIQLQGALTHVYNNTLYNNVAGLGVFLSCEGAGNKFWNNVAYDFTEDLDAAISDGCFGPNQPSGFGTSEFYNNTFYNLLTYAVDDSDGPTDMITVNNIALDGRANNLPSASVTPAYFVDPNNGNFRLTASATGAIDQVSVSPFSASDADGTPVQGSARDYGAYEFSAASTDRYASPTGSGSACTSGSPCNLQTATSQAQPGETVWLNDGNYNPTNMGFGDNKFTTARSGTAANPIVFRAINSRQAIINAAVDDLVNVAHSHIQYLGLQIDGFYNSNYGGQGDGLVHVNDSTTNILFDDVFIRRSGGVGFKVQQGVTNVTLRNSEIRGTGYTRFFGESIYIGRNNQPYTNPWTENISIHDNVFIGFTENAVNLKNLSRNVDVYNNVMYDQALPSQRPGCTDPECADREGTIQFEGQEAKVYNNIGWNLNPGIAVIVVCEDGLNSAYNNVFYDIHTDQQDLISDGCYGANQPSGVGISQVYNNTFYDALNYNIDDSDGPQDLIIRNNISVDGRANNLTSAATLPSYFVAPALGNFQLTSSATGAIDQATVAPFSTLDALGVGIQGPARDYGAYEFVPGSSVSLIRMRGGRARGGRY